MKMSGRAFALLLTVASAIGLLPGATVPARPVEATTLEVSATASASGPSGLRSGRFVDANGQPVFLLGANYEGPADRAWQMWDDGKFDPGLIAADLDRA